MKVWESGRLGWDGYSNFIRPCDGKYYIIGYLQVCRVGARQVFDLPDTRAIWLELHTERDAESVEVMGMRAWHYRDWCIDGRRMTLYEELASQWSVFHHKCPLYLRCWHEMGK